MVNTRAKHIFTLVLLLMLSGSIVFANASNVVIPEKSVSNYIVDQETQQVPNQDEEDNNTPELPLPPMLTEVTAIDIATNDSVLQKVRERNDQRREGAIYMIDADNDAKISVNITYQVIGGKEFAGNGTTQLPPSMHINQGENSTLNGTISGEPIPINETDEDIESERSVTLDGVNYTYTTTLLNWTYTFNLSSSYVEFYSVWNGLTEGQRNTPSDGVSEISKRIIPNVITRGKYVQSNTTESVVTQYEEIRSNLQYFGLNTTANDTFLYSYEIAQPDLEAIQNATLQVENGTLPELPPIESLYTLETIEDVEREIDMKGDGKHQEDLGRYIADTNVTVWSSFTFYDNESNQTRLVIENKLRTVTVVEGDPNVSIELSDSESNNPQAQIEVKTSLEKGEVDHLIIAYGNLYSERVNKSSFQTNYTFEVDGVYEIVVTAFAGVGMNTTSVFFTLDRKNPFLETLIDGQLSDDGTKHMYSATSPVVTVFLNVSDMETDVESITIDFGDGSTVQTQGNGSYTHVYFGISVGDLKTITIEVQDESGNTVTQTYTIEFVQSGAEAQSAGSLWMWVSLTLMVVGILSLVMFGVFRRDT